MRSLEKIPSLRIAVTNKCNFSCAYCPKDGDSYILETDNKIKLGDFVKISKLSYNQGVRYFSITGGEPLLNPKLTFSIAREIRKFKEVHYLRLNTNGSLITKYIQQIEQVPFDKVKVSLDSLTSKYSNEILDGINLLQDAKIPIRLHAVVNSENINEVQEIINYSKQKGLELKLFDMAPYKDSKSKDSFFWSKNFVSLLPLKEMLTKKYGKPMIRYSSGGFGNPMFVYKTDSKSEIVLRTSEVKGKYHESCKKCNDYFCWDGLCNITLTPEGILKLCKPKGIFNQQLVASNDNLLSDQEISKKIKKAIQIFQDSFEIKRGFNELYKKICPAWKK